MYLQCRQFASPHEGDGEYWIDPERNGSSLKVFCDMATDGGKHCKQLVSAILAVYRTEANLCGV